MKYYQYLQLILRDVTKPKYTTKIYTVLHHIEDLEAVQ